MPAEESRPRQLLPHSRPGPNEAVDLEIQNHLEECVDRLVAAGMSPDEARQEAERSFGDVKRVEEELRTVARETELRAAVAATFENTMNSLIQDVRLAVRVLLKHRLVTFVATLSLALAIAGNTTVFSLVSASMFQGTLAYEPERLVNVFETDSYETNDQRLVSSANFVDWRERSRSFDELA